MTEPSDDQQSPAPSGPGAQRHDPRRGEHSSGPDGDGQDPWLSDDEDGRRFPTADQPLNAEKRPLLSPALAVVALVAVVAGLVAVLTWLRYTT